MIEETIYPSVTEEVLRRARETPTATAVARDGQVRTYQELAGRVAWSVALLRDSGLAPGACVALQGPCSFEVVAAILGAWHHGAVILLLDPRLPEARQSWMLEVARAERILHVGACFHDLDRPYLRLDDGVEIAPPTSNGNEPRDPAYICFTSGSTGTPNGVLGRHNSLAHFLSWQRNTFAVGAGDRVAQLTGFSFDVVLRELFLPLTSGAALCLPPRHADPINPWQWLGAERITRLHAVPSLASLWLEGNTERNACPSLRTTFFAGEPLTDTLVRRWRVATSPDLDVINLYGPTETTLAKCWYRVPTEPRAGIQPIGAPLPDCEVLILDGDRSCAAGETGEIALRTPHRALGYLGESSDPLRPFVANPLHERADDLVYRTGDLGRRRPDGELEILGRLDDQIKIRGVRIEPQEIMLALMGHPSVRDAFVMPNPRKANTLLGYVCTKEPGTTPGDLIRYLSQLLPAALVPQQIFALDRLPLNENGKVDRGALPLSEERIRSRSRLLPATETERTLAGIWRDLLGVESLHREDGFFHLGGHSLMAARLLNRVRDAWGVSLELQDVFDRHRLSDLARLIQERSASSEPCGGNGVPEVARGEPQEASYSQRRMWFQSRMEPDRGAYNIPGAVRCTGLLDPELLQLSLDLVVARHESLRTRFSSRHGRLLQIVDPEARIELRQAEVSDDLDAVRRLALADARAPFDLEIAPLARALLIRQSAERHFLAYTFHHAIADGRSNVVFIRELQQSYLALEQGKEPTLPPLGFQCVEYASWERAWIESRLEPQLRYWEQRLATAPPCLALPMDSPRQQVIAHESGRGNTVDPPAVAAHTETALTRSLPRKWGDRLTRLCRESRSTPFMVFLAVFDVLLSTVSGQSDICVGTPVANRHLTGSEHLIGCFINTLVIRAEMDRAMTFVDLLEQVRSRTLEAFDNQDVPFEQVVARVAPRRDPAHHPLFQVLLNVLYHEEARLVTDELTMEREWLVDPESKFDLTLYVRQTRDDLHLHLVYDRARYERDLVAAWLEDFESILERCLDDPNLPVAALAEPVIKTPRAEPPQARTPAVPPAPESPTEHRVAEVWCDVLAVPSVRRQDSFFELGGHSLQVMRVLHLLQERHGTDAPPSLLFHNPNLSDFAAALDRYRAPDLPAIVRQGGSRPSKHQQDIWQHQQEHPESCAYNVPRALRIRGPLSPSVLRRAVDTVVARHRMLRTVYEAGETGLRARLLAPSQVMRVVDLEASSANDAKRKEAAHIQREARRPFQLSKDIPLRLLLLRRSAEDWTLLITTHHVVADCWSMGEPFQSTHGPEEPWNPGVFVSEVLESYRSHRAETTPQLPSLSVEFADLVAWWESNRKADRYREHAAYWRTELRDAPFALPLAVDKPRPNVFDHTGSRTEFEVSEGLYPRVMAFARHRGTTPFAVLLTAYGRCLWDWTGGAKEIVVGIPVSNRQRAETRAVIGLLSNTLLVRMRLGAEAGDLLDNLTRVLNLAYRYQDYPLSWVLRDLGIERDPSHPEVQLRFSMQQADVVPKAVPGLTVTPVGIDRGISRHDLTLVMAVHGTRLRGWWEFNTNVFLPRTIDDLTERYLDNLEHMVGQKRMLCP